MSDRSELAVLVETEARLDRAIATARQAASDARDGAVQRARDALRVLDETLAREEAKIVAAIAAETTARIAAIDLDAQRATARYEAVQGDEIARLLSRRLEEDT